MCAKFGVQNAITSFLPTCNDMVEKQLRKSLKRIENYKLAGILSHQPITVLVTRRNPWSKSDAANLRAKKPCMPRWLPDGSLVVSDRTRQDADNQDSWSESVTNKQLSGGLK